MANELKNVFPLTSVPYAQQFPQGVNVSPVLLGVAINAASAMIARRCKVAFYAKHYLENYGGRRLNYLMLRNAKLVMLNSVVAYPDGPSTTYTASSFDIWYGISKLVFKPSVTGAFFDLWEASQLMPMQGQNAIQVDYLAGYGFATSLAAPISAGVNVPLSVAATTGFTPDQGQWDISDSMYLCLGGGSATSEIVSVSMVGTQLTAASVKYAHALGETVAGGLYDDQVQYGCWLLASNILNAGDLTKKMEAVGHLTGYTQQLRDPKASALWTPEIEEIFAPYKEVPV